MSTKNWTGSAKGADDFELGIPRTHPLIYHCTAPTSGRMAGLAFLIPDFSDDVDGDEYVKLREYLAQTYGLLAVSVEYHCYRSRLKDGARLELSDEESSSLSKLCMSHGVALLDQNALTYALQQLPTAYEFEFRVVPADGEYQDLGVMQAMDHLLVLHDIVTNMSGAELEIANTIVMGHGYGGYLAHLIAKIAPNTVRAVFEVSALTEAPVSYLFGSRYGDKAPYYYNAGKVRIFPLIATNWTDEKSSPRYFSAARQSIRNLATMENCAAMWQNARQPCSYRIGVIEQAEQGFAEKKRKQAETLTQAGFDVVLRECGTGDADGTTWAVLIKKIFEEYYPQLPARVSVPDYVLGSSIAYLCADTIYSFEHGHWGCRMYVELIAPLGAQQYAYY